MDDALDLYTIGQVADRTGMPVRTIRFWSDSGVVPPVERSTGGYRLYDVAAVAWLDLVRTLRELGLGLEAIQRLLAGQATLGELAQSQVEALDGEIRTLRLRRAVLRTVAARSSSREETVLMHQLAKLSAGERRRIIDDFVDSVFADTADDDSTVIAAWMRDVPAELPDDATTAQVDAWLEFAELVTDEGFQSKIRSMVLDGAGDNRLEFGLNIRPLVMELAGHAIKRSIAPGSPEGRAVLDRIVPRDLPVEETSALIGWLEVVADARVERYWQLVAVLNGTDPGAPAVPAFEWLLGALRAHRECHDRDALPGRPT
ncbi:MerR family transcriptional regulator [Catellatospora paridis]|uniref:MerR family transcriptional regulator n=1 Tax=Catellatospora paridis TaxID=1617086 RepID=UPI0012D3E54D|nr:MerR family transcriptional regulator [Catellatospora paridis]